MVTIPQRKDDIALIVCQNNDDASLIITEADNGFADLCATQKEALCGTSFMDILGKKTIDYLEDAIEYSPDGADLAEACLRLREIRFKTKQADGDIICSFRVERMESPDGHGWFRVIIPGEERRAIREMLHQSLQQYFVGQSSVSEDTGLPTGDAIASYLTMLRNVLPERNMDACCALLRIDRFDKSMARYGKSGALQLLSHVANCCKSTFRSEDIVCQLNNHTLAMFLVDINHDAARVVLNRLRWNIHNHRIAFGGKEDFSVTVSIAFGSVMATDTILDQCSEKIDALSRD
jgi:diguanylate cyclase (GGDEF)-like protein